MEICVHLTSGKTHVFQTEERIVEEIVASIHPARLYEQSPIEIIGSRSAMLLNPAFIEYIEFKTRIRPAGVPGIPPRSPQLEEQLSRSFEPMKLISADEYEASRRELMLEASRNEPPAKEGRDLHVVARLCFQSGTVLHLRLKGWLGPGEGRRFVARNVFAAPALGAIWEHEGFVLINPKNLNSFAATPAPLDTSKLAWRAEPVTHVPA